jgi:hypothetical protein
MVNGLVPGLAKFVVKRLPRSLYTLPRPKLKRAITQRHADASSRRLPPLNFIFELR